MLYLLYVLMRFVLARSQSTLMFLVWQKFHFQPTTYNTYKRHKDKKTYIYIYISCFSTIIDIIYTLCIHIPHIIPPHLRSIPFSETTFVFQRLQRCPGPHFAAPVPVPHEGEELPEMEEELEEADVSFRFHWPET